MTTKTILTLSVVAAMVTSGCSLSTSGLSPEENRIILNQALSARFITASGASMSLADVKGNIVLLHFISPHCDKCREEAPSLRRLHESFKDSRFSIVGVAAEGADPYATRAFALQNNLPFPILIDTDGSLGQFFSITEVPSTIFLNREGVPLQLQDPNTGEVSSVITGARAWDTEKPVEMIAALVESF